RWGTRWASSAPPRQGGGPGPARGAGGRRPGRLRVRDGLGRAHAPLPRAPPRGERAPDRADGARERPRGLGRDTAGCRASLLAVLRARRGPPRRGDPPRVVRGGAVAQVALSPAGRRGDRTGDRGAPWSAARAGRVATRDARGRRPALRAAARLRPRLPRAPPREPGLRLRAARDPRGAPALRALSRRARDRPRRQCVVRARA